jgi:pimeloyl-ACP methyl ester carboxylesterase
VKTRPILIVLAFALVVVGCSTSGQGAAQTAAPTPASATPVPGTTGPEVTDSTPPPSPVTGPPSAPPSTGVPLPTYTPIFEPADCAFVQPDDHTASCGYLTVPENRLDPQGRQVRLHVARFATETATPSPDPVVYLEGGPGGHALEGLQFSFNERFAPFLTTRDLIIFDQRGVGFSTPALGCPEVRVVELDLLDDVVSAQDYTARETEALQSCRDRLVAEGVDLSHYNSKTNAADLADLRVTLGIEAWNLYGISYGTRLALTAMRDHPEGVRSVILDSTVPLDIRLPESTPSSADRAFQAFFASCAAAVACAATFPDLATDFAELRTKLDASPATVQIMDFLTGDSHRGVLTGEDVVGLVFQSLYSEQLIPILPDVIKDGNNGDLRGIIQLASLFFTNNAFISLGMYLSVQCNEEYPFSSVGAVEQAVAEHPGVAALFPDVTGEFSECAVWNSGTADPLENLAVSSNIPTLILSGQFDPITPPEYGIHAGATLPQSFFFQFPGLSHGVSSAHECPLGITLAFLDNPTAPPVANCIGDMGAPSFLTPDRSA